MDDTCVPIAFTEYRIAIPTAKVDLPKFMNDRGIADFNTPGQMSDLGHAGCLFIKGASGLTRYYEYGRYDSAALGLARRQSLPDLRLDRGGQPVWASLKDVLGAISTKAGKGGLISAAWIAAPGRFDAMQAYADKRMADNRLATRIPYSLFRNSCLHFMKGVMDAAGIRTPILVDPRPVSYIDEIKAIHTPLDFNPRTNLLTIGGQVKT